MNVLAYNLCQFVADGFHTIKTSLKKTFFQESAILAEKRPFSVVEHLRGLRGNIRCSSILRLIHPAARSVCDIWATCFHYPAGFQPF